MTKTILFICTGNTCRSAMAEGMFKKINNQKKTILKKKKKKKGKGERKGD